MAELPRALTSADIEVLVERKFDAGLSEHKIRADARWDAVGDALGETRKQLRSEIQEQVGLLRADLTIEKAAERRERGDVVELPKFIGRRHDVASSSSPAPSRPPLSAFPPDPYPN